MKLHYKYIVSIVILILINLLLITEYLILIKSTSEFKEQLKRLDADNRVYSLNGTKLHFFETKTQKFKQIKNKNYKIIGVFSNKVCGSCIFNEIQHWYKMNKKFNIQIIYIFKGDGSPNRVLKNIMNKYKFPIFSYSSVFTSVNNLDNIFEPVTLLLDNNIVVAGHRALKDEPENSKLFYQKITSNFFKGTGK